MMPTNVSAQEEAVLEMLQRTGPCYLDNLALQLPNFSWSQVFLAVDRMSREGLVLLQRRTCSAYYVALPSRPASPHSSRHEEAQL